MMHEMVNGVVDLLRLGKDGGLDGETWPGPWAGQMKTRSQRRRSSLQCPSHMQMQAWAGLRSRLTVTVNKV